MNKYKSLIILDWDDTLFPTSWIIKNNIDIDNKQMQNEYIVYFLKLDFLVSQLLLNLSKYGQVVIITNASLKWILMSSAILPKTQQVLKTNTLVISARDVYHNKYPENMNMWKKKAFENIVNNYFENYKLQNIVSGGDAEYEFYALTDLYNDQSIANNRLLKTVRFIKNPSFYDLLDQLDVFNKCAQKVLLNMGHLDLKFKSK